MRFQFFFSSRGFQASCCRRRRCGSFRCSNEVIKQERGHQERYLTCAPHPRPFVPHTQARAHTHTEKASIFTTVEDHMHTFVITSIISLFATMNDGGRKTFLFYIINIFRNKKKKDLSWNKRAQIQTYNTSWACFASDSRLKRRQLGHTEFKMDCGWIVIWQSGKQAP